MSPLFFESNRVAISSALKGGLIVVAAYSALQRSNDASHPFEQEANFWYLTGINEPDWWVIIDGSTHKSWLVAPDIDEVHRTFDGGLSSYEAGKISGIETIISQKDSESLLRDLAKKHSIVHTLGEHPYKSHFSFVENPAQKKMWSFVERLFNSVQDCRLELAKLRAIKQPEEIATIRKAIRLTSQAFELTKQRLSTLSYEYDVEAEFDYFFKKQGARHGYEPIVAGGNNACTLHYIKNNQKLKKNSLLLIDIGAKVGGYTADITRTYAYGSKTQRQQDVHQAVEAAHQKIINLIMPDFLVAEYQKQVDVIMKQALIGLGLMRGMDDDDAYRTYFPHAVSHGLGIDVHDSLGGATYFKPGMVLTVEPGIYIPQEGIGVRIEDDILVTKTGHENLSRQLSTGL